jgi:hypothetical protein
MVEGILIDAVANLVVEVVHKPAFLYGEYLVEGSSDVEADAWLGESLILRHGLELLASVPSLVATAEVEFVAIFPRLDAALDGREGWEGYLAYASELVFYLLLFEGELFLIGQVLPFASSTDAKVLALGLYALG